MIEYREGSTPRVVIGDRPDSIYRYWGKSAREGEPGAGKHLLVYHLLDVAAVARGFGLAWTSTANR